MRDPGFAYREHLDQWSALRTPPTRDAAHVDLQYLQKIWAGPRASLSKWSADGISGCTQCFKVHMLTRLQRKRTKACWACLFTWWPVTAPVVPVMLYPNQVSVVLWFMVLNMASVDGARSAANSPWDNCTERDKVMSLCPANLQYGCFPDVCKVPSTIPSPATWG